MTNKDIPYQEEWRPVLGYEGRYWVSNLGNIKSRFGKLKGVRTPHGYILIGLYVKNKSKLTFLHRIVCGAFIGACPDKFVNHKNGVKDDNRLENLEWVTKSENTIHAYRNGLQKAHPCLGTKHYRAKLTDDQVRSIRTEKIGVSQLAKKYSVSETVIRKVIKRISWKHIN